MKPLLKPQQTQQLREDTKHLVSFHSALCCWLLWPLAGTGLSPGHSGMVQMPGMLQVPSPLLETSWLLLLGQVSTFLGILETEPETVGTVLLVVVLPGR